MAVAALVIVNVTGTESLAANGPRDCNNNSIVYCGALSQDELLQKFDQNATGDLPAIYAHYGIARSDMTGQTSQVVMGKTFRDGRVEVNGKVVATGAQSLGRGNNNGSRPIGIAGKTYFESPNSVIFLSDSIDTYVMMRNGQFHAAIITSCANPLRATPTPPPSPKPQPKYSCDALQAQKIARTEYKFTTQTTATNGAQVVGYSYDFGDGKKADSQQNMINHTYENAGTYTTKVTVKVMVDGQVKIVNGPKCETQVIVTPPPATPVYKCDDLTAKLINSKDNDYEYALAYTVEGGAVLKSVDYNFGDGQTATLGGDKEQVVSHKYAQAGDYTTVATLKFEVPQGEQATVKDVNCEVKVSISPEMCDVPGFEEFPKDSPKCVVPVTPVTPTPKQPPVMPAELPKTGISSFISGGLGLGSITAAAYYWVESRRALNGKMFNR